MVLQLLLGVLEVTRFCSEEDTCGMARTRRLMQIANVREPALSRTVNLGSVSARIVRFFFSTITAAI